MTLPAVVNIGFDLELSPFSPSRLLTAWQIRAKVSDSAHLNEQETRTEYEGVTLVRDNRKSPLLLADLAQVGRTIREDRTNL